MKSLCFVGLRRAVPAALFAASVALPSIALGYPAIGIAAPNDGSSVREWDIEKFDACMARNPLPPGERYCCDRSGGVTDYRTGKCKAPPAAPAGQQTQAPGQVPPNFGEPGMTLWTPPPPPPGPAAPPPNEAVR